MDNFEFKNPVKLIFGEGQIAKLAQELPKSAKIMMTYGGGSIKANGVYDQVIAALEGFDYIEFSGIEPNPRYETLIKAVELAHKNKVDYLLAVGGGSVVDGTKFIAAAMDYKGDNAWELMLDARKMISMNPIPLAAVLTLPATGSEMNFGAVVSREETKEKFAFHHPGVFPQFSILDPTVCYSLPIKQVQNGLIDTFVHVMEQYLTKQTNSFVQDRFSEGVLSTIVEIAPALMAGEKSYDLMANFMYAATMGLNGFLSMGVPQDWATHMIGHELTALHGLDHGHTLALVEPSLMNVMREDKGDKIVQYGKRVWGIECDNKDEAIDLAIAKTRELFELLGVVPSLAHYGVTNESIEEICRRFESRDVKFGENANVTAVETRKILEMAM